MNGLDMADLTVNGFRGGAVWRNEANADGEDGWFYSIGSCETRGPFATKELAISDATKRYGS